MTVQSIETLHDDDGAGIAIPKATQATPTIDLLPPIGIVVIAMEALRGQKHPGTLTKRETCPAQIHVTGETWLNPSAVASIPAIRPTIINNTPRICLSIHQRRETSLFQTMTRIVHTVRRINR